MMNFTINNIEFTFYKVESPESQYYSSILFRVPKGSLKYKNQRYEASCYPADDRSAAYDMVKIITEGCFAHFIEESVLLKLATKAEAILRWDVYDYLKAESGDQWIAIEYACPPIGAIVYVWPWASTSLEHPVSKWNGSDFITFLGDPAESLRNKWVTHWRYIVDPTGKVE